MTGGRPALVIRQAVRGEIGWRRPGSSRHPSPNPANHARRASRDRSRRTVIITQSARYTTANGHGRFLRASQTRLRASSRYQVSCLALCTAGWHTVTAASYSIRYPRSSSRHDMSVSSCPKKNASGCPPASRYAERLIAHTPPANVVTTEDRSGSDARSRGTCQRPPEPPSGSVTRNDNTASIGSAANLAATCSPSAAASGYQASSSRNSTTSPPQAWTPALRPPATPAFSASLIVVTPAGAGPASPPLPTITSSAPDARSGTVLSIARDSSSCRLPMVKITIESFNATASRP